MSNRRNVGVGMILTAAVALVLSTVAAIGAPAQAAPGDATITATPNSGLSDLQVISVSGNAGPLSTVLRGPAGSQTSDKLLGKYPALHVSMCLKPLTASSCDTDLSNFGSPVTTNPDASPHVVDVVPNAATGAWGPIQFLVRQDITNGDGTFTCGTGAMQCFIGSANAPRPTDHSYDATASLTFTAAPEPSASATDTGSPSASPSVSPSPTKTTSSPTPTATQPGGLSITYSPSVVADGTTISVRGNAGKPNAPRLYVAVCETTPTATNCDQSLEDLGTAKAHILQVTPDKQTGAWGPVNFYVRQVIVTGDSESGFDCKKAGTCVIGSTNAMNPKDHTYNTTAALRFSAAPVPVLPPTLPASDGALSVSSTSLTAGGATTVSGSGFAPETPVTVGMYSAPVRLATATTDAGGSFSAQVRVPKSAAAGPHTLVAIGATTAGPEQTLTQAVTLTISTASPTPTGTGSGGSDDSGSPGGTGDTLAATGASGNATLPLVGAAALALLLLGLILSLGSGGRARS